MRLSKNELLVHINPYVALNHDGMPVGVVLYDPLEGRQGEAHFIGARIAKREVRRADVPAKRGNALRKDRRSPRFATRVEHDLAPQRVPHTAHHIVAIESGSLIPANEATAAIARVPFVAPAERLAAARDTAIATWTRDYGVPPPVADWPALAIPAVPVPQATATGPAVVATVAPSTAPTPGAAPAPAPSPAPAAAAPAPAPAASPMGPAAAPPSSAATPIVAPPSTAAASPPVPAVETPAAAAPSPGPSAAAGTPGTPAPGAPPPPR